MYRARHSGSGGRVSGSCAWRGTLAATLPPRARRVPASPHLGAWGLAGLWFATHVPMTTLYRAPRVREMEPVYSSARRRSGATLVSGAGGVRALYEALGRGEVAALLPDQDPRSGGGIFAPFFGVPAHEHAPADRRAQPRQRAVHLRRAPEEPGSASTSALARRRSCPDLEQATRSTRHRGQRPHGAAPVPVDLGKRFRVRPPGCASSRAAARAACSVPVERRASRPASRAPAARCSLRAQDEQSGCVVWSVSRSVSRWAMPASSWSGRWNEPQPAQATTSASSAAASRAGLPAGRRARAGAAENAMGPRCTASARSGRAGRAARPRRGGWVCAGAGLSVTTTSPGPRACAEDEIRVWQRARPRQREREEWPWSPPRRGARAVPAEPRTLVWRPPPPRRRQEQHELHARRAGARRRARPLGRQARARASMGAAGTMRLLAADQ
jgi:hypothetical protein